MKVRYTETALRELDEIFAYIFEHDRSAATGVIERVERLAALLVEFPFVGHETDEAGVRVVPLVRYPFLIFYTVNTTKWLSFTCAMARACSPGKGSRRVGNTSSASGATGNNPAIKFLGRETSRAGSSPAVGTRVTFA